MRRMRSPSGGELCQRNPSTGCRIRVLLFIYGAAVSRLPENTFRRLFIPDFALQPFIIILRNTHENRVMKPSIEIDRFPECSLYPVSILLG